VGHLNAISPLRLLVGASHWSQFGHAGFVFTRKLGFLQHVERRVATEVPFHIQLKLRTPWVGTILGLSSRSPPSFPTHQPSVICQFGHRSSPFHRLPVGNLLHAPQAPEMERPLRYRAVYPRQPSVSLLFACSWFWQNFCPMIHTALPRDMLLIYLFGGIFRRRHTHLFVSAASGTEARQRWGRRDRRRPRNCRRSLWAWRRRSHEIAPGQTRLNY